ncbi:MAG: replicative DNA helicase, partial [Candidatus Sumerlaeia bacterium]|nr:replicative DNA helicase [Candidatus Sumerlaeia bacterium]
IIYEQILNVYHRDGAVDLTTLCDELLRIKALDKVGGPAYVASLEDAVVTSANIEHHIRIVFGKSKLRRFIETTYNMLEDAYNEISEPDKILENAESSILEITRDRAKKDFVHIGEIVPDAINELSLRYQNKTPSTGLKTGFKKLDNLITGFHPGESIIIAGKSSMGKTAFALNIALNVTKNRIPVGIFSMEMSARQINERLLSMMAQVSIKRVRDGYFSSEDLRRMTEKGKELSNYPIYIDDTPGLTSIDVRARAHRLKSLRENLGMIIVDYLQLLRSGRRAENRQQEVAEVSHMMKRMAMELNIPVILLSQLSRMVDRRISDNRPILSDLRESGAIEQDADMVLFVHRPEFEKKRRMEKKYDDDQMEQYRPERGEICEIIVGKQRNGPIGTVKLIFFPEFTLFALPHEPLQ